MTLTVTHQFVSGVADDPTAAAAGEVLPSHWNAQHVVTGVALQVATGNITLQVSKTGSDSSGDGSVAHPYATIQHAINVAQGYDYGGIYFPSINVSHGTYVESPVASNLFNCGFNSAIGAGVGLLQGDATSPTSVKIAPNNPTGTQVTMIFQNNANWAFSGFSLVCDPNNNPATIGIQTALLRIISFSNVYLGTLDFDGGTGLEQVLFGTDFREHSTQGDFFDGGSLNWTFHAANGISPQVISTIRRDTFAQGPPNLYVFTTTINLGGGAFTQVDNGSFYQVFTPITGASNVTGGSPIQMAEYGQLAVSDLSSGNPVDPTSVTLPGGSFDPTQIDATSSINGFFYTQQSTSNLVDQSTINRGAWQIHKNSTTGSVNIISDNAGILGFPAVPFLILANGTSPEGVYVYNTVDNPYSPTNYERAIFDWNFSAGTCVIATQSGGTGSARNLKLISAGPNLILQAASGAGQGILFQDGGNTYAQILSAGTFFLGLPGINAGGLNNVASKVLSFNDGTGGNVGGWMQWAGQARVTADVTSTSTSLATAAGLSVNVAAGRTYGFCAELSWTDAAAGGLQLAMGGSATATNIIYDGYIIDSAANGIKGNAQATALGSIVASAATSGTAGHATINGTITVNTAGTLLVQFAQNTSNATATTIKRGSYMLVQDMP